MATIKFVVDKEGQVHIEVDGVEGASCADLTRIFEERLGVKVDVQEKPEYYCELDNHEAYVHEEE